MLDTLNGWATYAFLFGGWPIQTTFLLLYVRREWRRYRPTRALMNKSFSLWLLMTNGAIVLLMFGMRPLDWPDWLIVFRVVCYVYMLWALFYQCYALIREILEGRPIVSE